MSNWLLVKVSKAISTSVELFFWGGVPLQQALSRFPLEELEISDKYNRLSSDTTYIGYILKFCKPKHLSFEEIDERFLKKLKNHLIKEHSLCLTSVMNVFVFIRMLYNKAIKFRIVKKKVYPFLIFIWK